MQMQNQNLHKKSYTRKNSVVENELPNLYRMNTVLPSTQPQRNQSLNSQNRKNKN